MKRAGIKNPWFEAQFLLGWVLGKEQALVLAHDDEVVSEPMAKKYWQGVRQRCERRPLAYIIGYKPFLHWDFYVSEDVLVPRPETELLVESAIEELNRRDSASTVLVADIGVGSGAIGLSILKLFPSANLHAVDSSPPALAVARINASRLGLTDRAVFYVGDLLTPLRPFMGQYDCIVANLPYIPRAEYEDLPPEISKYEPKEALVSGEDGLWHCRLFIVQVADYLLPGGSVFVEIGSSQVREILNYFKAAGFACPAVVKDLAGLPRIVWGTKPE